MRCKFSSLISLPEHNTRHGNRASRVCQASWSLKIWTCLGCCVSPQEDWSFQYPVPENKVERFLRWKQWATNVIYLKCRGLVVSFDDIEMHSHSTDRFCFGCYGFEFSNSKSPEISGWDQGHLGSNFCSGNRIRFTKEPTEQAYSSHSISQRWLGSYRGRNVSCYRSFLHITWSPHHFSCLATACSCTSTSSLEMAVLKSWTFKLFYQSMEIFLLSWAKHVVELWTFRLLFSQLPSLTSQRQVGRVIVRI